VPASDGTDSHFPVAPILITSMSLARGKALGVDLDCGISHELMAALQPGRSLALRFGMLETQLGMRMYSEVKRKRMLEYEQVIWA
jgi:hypothetical protein